MHIVKDENGNLCPHGHEHTHAHTHSYEHSHEHTHEHGHEDAHEHTHGHGHEDAHEHSHGESACAGKECTSECGGCKPGNQNEALLTYMLSHNEHHAVELDQMAEKLRQSGQEKAAEQIRKAVDEFQKGNMYLGVALALVKEQ